MTTGAQTPSKTGVPAIDCTGGDCMHWFGGRGATIGRRHQEAAKMTVRTVVEIVIIVIVIYVAVRFFIKRG
jgi:hypothetical protein